MDIETLQTFLILASTKSYTKTAGQMFVAQSTITKRIKELEKELQLSLFERTNRSVKLTIEGEQFKTYAEQVVELTEESLSHIASIRHFDRHIRIGSADSIYEGHLTPSILKYREEHPTDSLRISIGLSNNLLEQVQGNLLDLVFTYLPLKKANYSCEVYKQERLVLVTDAKNKKYKKGIKHQDLINEKYLMCNFALHDVGEYIKNLFPKYHQFEFVIDDCMKIVPYLINHDNYTFLPEDMAETHIKDGILREVKLIDFKTPVINSYMVYRKDKRKMLDDLITQYL